MNGISIRVYTRDHMKILPVLKDQFMDANTLSQKSSEKMLSLDPMCS